MWGVTGVLRWYEGVDEPDEPDDPDDEPDEPADETPDDECIGAACVEVDVW